MALKFTTPLRPTERKDYTCDWSAEMKDTGDAIESATFTLAPSAAEAALEIYLTQLSGDGKKAAMWLKSNNPELTRAAILGQSISIFHTIVTTQGRHLSQTLQIKISEN